MTAKTLDVMVKFCRRSTDSIVYSRIPALHYNEGELVATVIQNSDPVRHGLLGWQFAGYTTTEKYLQETSA